MRTIDLNKILKEVRFNFSRSGGRGGQNVNKVETKAELVFNIENSNTLDDESRLILLKKLARKLDNDGDLSVMSQTERTQLGNRKKAIAKFAKLLEGALKRENVRIKTIPTHSSKLVRLEQKKKHAAKKKIRSVKVVDDE